VPPGRSTFIDEIIQKIESQASVGRWKGSIEIPQAMNSPIVAHAEVHSETKGIEQRFQIKHTPLYSPLDEGNSCNLKEWEGKTSGVAGANPPPPEPRSLVILIG